MRGVGEGCNNLVAAVEKLVPIFDTVQKEHLRLSTKIVEEALNDIDRWVLHCQVSKICVDALTSVAR